MKESLPVVLVTKDILLRMKAQILGIQSEDFLQEQVSCRESQYTGRCECFVPEEVFKNFKKKGIPLETVYQTDAQGNPFPPELW